MGDLTFNKGQILYNNSVINYKPIEDDNLKWADNEDGIFDINEEVSQNLKWSETKEYILQNNSGIYDFDGEKLIIYITPDSIVPTFSDYTFVKKDRVKKYNKIFDQCEFIKIK